MGAYASRDGVKSRLLLGITEQGGRRIDTSEFYRDLRPDPANEGLVGGIRLRRVRFDDAWFGVVNFLITFTSATEFDASMVPVPNEAEIPLGSGDIASIFIADNPYVPLGIIYTIEPEDWTGVAMAGNKVSWSSTSSISNVMVDEAIDRVEYKVDNVVLATKKIVMASTVSKIWEASPPVPGIIVKITEDITCYTIAQSVLEGDISETRYQKMLDEALADLELFIKRLKTRGPTWYTRDPIIPASSGDKVGTPTFGVDMTWRQNMQTSLQDVVSRLRNYTKDRDVRNLVSQDSNFP